MSELKFEQALDKLSDINEKIESGDISLDESIELFKEGIELTKKCQAILENARKEVEELEKQ